MHFRIRSCIDDFVHLLSMRTMQYKCNPLDLLLEADNLCFQRELRM